MAVQYNEDVLALIDAKLAPLTEQRQRLFKLREAVVEGLQGPYALSPAAVNKIIADVRADIPEVAASWKGANASEA